MGYWGVKSYENDEADEAIDRAFERVYGALYEELMDDRNPLTREAIQARLASPETLRASVDSLVEEFGPISDDWDEFERLGFVGAVVLHAELGVSIPEQWRLQALGWLETESIDWDEETLRKLRLSKEVAILQAASSRAGG